MNNADPEKPLDFERLLRSDQEPVPPPSAKRPTPEELRRVGGSLYELQEAQAEFYRVAARVIGEVGAAVVKAINEKAV